MTQIRNQKNKTNIIEWKKIGLLPDPTVGGQVITAKNKIYLLGGYNRGTGYKSSIFSANINKDGTIEEWVKIGSLPKPVAFGRAIKIKNRIYLLGGYNFYDSYLTDVYISTINNDGTLCNWVPGPSLPIIVARGRIINKGNHIYLLGGLNYTDDYLPDVYITSVMEDGMLSEWKVGPSLPTSICDGQAIIIKDKIHILGGRNDFDLFYAYTATINKNGDISEWSDGNWLVKPTSFSHSAIVENKVYLIGGYNRKNRYLSNVYVAPINEDGTIWPWVSDLSLPKPVAGGQIATIKNRIYLLGGFNDERDFLYDIYMATVNTDANS